MSREDFLQLQSPPFRRSYIAQVARNLFEKYISTVGPHRVLKNGIVFDELYERIIYPEFEIELDEGQDLGVDAKGIKILGRFDVDRNTAFIDRSLIGDRRRTFTRFHEVVGHGVLQGAWLRNHLKNKNLITSSAGIEPDVTEKLERQANICASMAAAPDGLLIHAIRSTYQRSSFVYLRPSKYFLTPAGRTLSFNVTDINDLSRLIARPIQRWFDGLSIESIGYRLVESPLIKDLSRREMVLLRRAG